MKIDIYFYEKNLEIENTNCLTCLTIIMISSSDHLHNDPTKTTATTTSNSSSYSPDKLSSDLAILVKAALLTRTRSGAEAQLNTAANITATSASSPNKASADILLEMEKTDEHFHKYSYIRHLQKKLSRTILPIIEKHLADDISTNDHQQQDLVLPLIVEKIMSTSEYKDLVNDQVEEARSCALDLINARKTMTSQSNSNTNNVAAGKSSDGGTLTAKDYYQQPQFIRLDDIFNPQEVNIVNDNSTSNTSAASPLLQHPHHQSTEASIICNTTNGGGAPISASSQRMMMPGTPSSAATTADETLSSISTSSNFFDDAAPLPGFNEIASMIATIHPSPASTSSSSVAGGSIAATSNTQEARLAAMHKFMSFSSSDLVCAELWPQTRRVMEVALGDSDCR